MTESRKNALLIAGIVLLMAYILWLGWPILSNHGESVREYRIEIVREAIRREAR